MKGLIGRKLGMTQVFDEDGTVTPVTIIEAGPCYVTQVKTDETDGYNAVQLGFGEVKEKKLSKAERGHLGLVPSTKKHGERKAFDAAVPPVRHLNEFRTDAAGDYTLGQQVTVETFEVGEMVDVTGTTKGRGFAGVVKRYNFAGGPKTHGQSDRWRAPGSAGAGSTPGRVFKGKRMPGRMGNERHTAQNLKVMRVDPERNLIAIKGAVAGTKGGVVIIRSAVKG